MTLVAQAHSARWLLAAIGTVLYVVFKYRVSKRLAAFQGPFGTGWSEIWHTRAILSLQSHLKYKEVNDKYGAFSTRQAKPLRLWLQPAPDIRSG
jgi:hypothetical protein